MQGRFITEGYSPFVGTDYNFLTADLGAFDASHPIMQGVTSASDYYRQMVDLAPCATPVARWGKFAISFLPWRGYNAIIRSSILKRIAVYFSGKRCDKRRKVGFGDWHIINKRGKRCANRPNGYHR